MKKFYLYLRRTNTSNKALIVRLKKNWTIIKEDRDGLIEITLDLNLNDIIILEVTELSGYSKTFSGVCIAELIKLVITWKPRELKSISNKAKTTLFWVHTDNTRITQE